MYCCTSPAGRRHEEMSGQRSLAGVLLSGSACAWTHGWNASEVCRKASGIIPDLLATQHVLWFASSEPVYNCFMIADANNSAPTCLCQPGQTRASPALRVQELFFHLPSDPQRFSSPAQQRSFLSEKISRPAPTNAAASVQDHPFFLSSLTFCFDPGGFIVVVRSCARRRASKRQVCNSNLIPMRRSGTDASPHP